MDGIVRTLRDCQTIVIATHIYPDGDALGSQLALGKILESLGKKVFLYSEEPVSYHYDFMPGSEVLGRGGAVPTGFDAAIAVDCGDRFRLGSEMEGLLAIHPFMVIDHHAGHKDFGDQRWVDASRSSTGEMIYDLAMALGAEISHEAAYCLYTAIVSDTGSFKYDSTSAHTFRVAGELLSRGVRPFEVAGKLFDNYTTNRLHLLKEVLGSLELHGDGTIGVISVTREMFEKTGASRGDTEDFINYPRAIATVKVAVFVKDGDQGIVSVSLRSKGEYDVAAVALKFGGGGHRNAAGFRVRDKAVSEVRDEILQELLRVVG